MTSTDITMVPLTRAEEIRLGELVTTVHSAIKSFVAAGKALEAIRAGRLYRATHSTFEAFVEEEFGYARQHAYRMIESAKVAEIVSPIGDIANEGQARALVGLDADQAREIYSTAVEDTGGKPTAKAIQEARRRATDPRVETMSAGEAEQRTSAIGEHLNAICEDLDGVLMFMLSNRIAPHRLVVALAVATRNMEKALIEPEISDPLRRILFAPRIDWLIEHGDEAAQRMHAFSDGDGTFKPLEQEQVDALLLRVEGAFDTVGSAR